MITEADYRAWTQQEIIPCIDVVLESFGPQRILYGSDWPICLMAGNYGKFLQPAKEFLKKFTMEEEQHFFLNAQRIYDFKLNVE